MSHAGRSEASRPRSVNQADRRRRPGVRGGRPSGFGELGVRYQATVHIAAINERLWPSSKHALAGIAGAPYATGFSAWAGACKTTITP
ncbi:hypothetical protein Acsp04_39620 [Actinomadura sp. NBRC 104425]|nr:hypothetical protein Acsp04_39620 [Actinomadura sp. NBRC 104425]